MTTTCLTLRSIFENKGDSHVDFSFDNDVSVEACTQTADHDLQRRAAILLRNNMFDLTGYFFHIRLVNARPDSQTTFTLISKEVFDCQGELRITRSEVYESITIVYEHKGHIETHKFHMTEEVRNYIRAQSRLAPRQIYQNLIQMADGLEFEKTDLHTITRQQVYWLSITKSEWGRDAANDFRSVQLLEKYNRSKMTEVFVDSTFGTNKHGYELYCVLTEYDLVSVPLSYLLLDTRGLHEKGKRGRRLTQRFAALRNAGLKPNTVHTDKDFAEVTAASIAFRTDNSGYNHHLCLWHSLRAIDQYITGKVQGRGVDSADTVKSSTRRTALPSYLHFLSEDTDQARVVRDMIKRHLLKHPLLPRVVWDKSSAPETLVYESYEEIHASSIKEMLEYCRSIGQPRLFR
ncbi:hypothetical protein V1524DRAFT_447531 [Lipomyces starkeyi]